MEYSVSPMQLMVSIVERGMGKQLIDFFKTYKLFHHIQASGRGTAASHLLDTLGFGTTERDIILTYGSQETIRQLMHDLRDDDRATLNVQGIAFSLNMSGMSTILAVCLSQMEELGTERRDFIVDVYKRQLLL